MMAMVAAMQKANSVQPARYLPELAKVNYEGVTGRITFDDRGDIKDGSLTLYTYKGGKREMMMVVK
jgi:branched-chain amino acid transport system substrate-binding protein